LKIDDIAFVVARLTAPAQDAFPFRKKRIELIVP
jgi:hypothetical protein